MVGRFQKASKSGFSAVFGPFLTVFLEGFVRDSLDESRAERFSGQRAPFKNRETRENGLPTIRA
jgi:hypothetical protein